VTELATHAPTRLTHTPAWRFVIAGALIGSAVWLFVAKAQSRMPDFEVYWRAGLRAAAAEPLYRPSDADYQFKYFPAFAIIAIPLGLLPLGMAKVLWFTLSAAALAALLPLSVSLLPGRRKPAWLLIAALCVGLGKYYAENLVLGQINTIVAFVAACALLAFRRGREAAAGAIVALAIVLKPYALILAPWVVARRRARAVVALFTTLTAGVALPVLVYGVDGTVELHRQWWETVMATTESTLLHSDNVSLASLWAKGLGVGVPATMLAGGSSLVLVVAAGAVLVRRGDVENPDGLELGLLLAITPLLSPQGWDYVLVLATTALIYVVNDLDRLPPAFRAVTAAAIGVIGLTLYDLVGRRILYALLDMSVITIAMLLLITALVTIRRRKWA
jgi:hypothetical protein